MELENTYKELLNNGLSVGVVIFAKNEEKSIGDLIDGILEYVDKQDVFVVDGHSSDKTCDVVRSKNIRVLLDAKMGKGAAIRQSIAHIDKDILVFMDSDGSHRAEEIYSLLEPFVNDEEVSMVIGSRFKGKSDEFTNTINEKIRYMGNIISVWLINLIYKSNLSDAQNGFRAIKRKELSKVNLTEKNFAIEQEMVMKCLKKRKKIVEVPSWELKRKHNKSHIRYFMIVDYVLSYIKNSF